MAARIMVGVVSTCRSIVLQNLIKPLKGHINGVWQYEVGIEREAAQEQVNTYTEHELVLEACRVLVAEGFIRKGSDSLKARQRAAQLKTEYLYKIALEYDSSGKWVIGLKKNGTAVVTARPDEGQPQPRLNCDAVHPYRYEDPSFYRKPQ
jgi:hypothetical protein